MFSAQIGGDNTVLTPHGAVVQAGARAVKVGGDGNHRHDREGQQRQLHIHREHNDYDAPEDEQIADNGHEAAGEKLVDGLRVTGQPRHDFAGRGAVVVGERQPLEVEEELAPQGHQHALAYPAHDEVWPKVPIQAMPVAAI